MSHTTFSIVTHSLWLELRHKSAPGDSYLASKLILGLLLCVVLSVAPLRLAAQTTSVIEGTITDPQHLAITGAEITLSGSMLTGEIKMASGPTGSFRIPGLRAEMYSLRVESPGFAAKVYETLPVTVNRLLSLDVVLSISTLQDVVTVSANPTLLETTISSSGATMLPQQVEQMPINGRNYLDLKQLVPGITINRQSDAGTDAAAPVLGERGGNAVFLIDGMPNSDAVDCGPAAPFNQASILEFQVLTAGFTAEFGHGPGGVVNVVHKSGTSQWHGLLSTFHRNSVLDSSDVPGKNKPLVLRWDPSASAGGPIVRDRVFIFGSLERIRESRQLNFVFPPSAALCWRRVCGNSGSGRRKSWSRKSRNWRAPTTTWSSLLMSRRMTCKSRCAWWPPIPSCWRSAIAASSMNADKYIGYAVEGALRMQTLILDPLAFSRADEPKRTARMANAALNNALENLRSAIEESGPVVTHDHLPAVAVDPTQLVQLFQNLIGNAIKFRGKEAPAIRVSAEKQEATWLFAVADNGIGVSSQYKEKIFVIFQRLHTREEYSGNGVGLAIRKEIVEHHGGKDLGRIGAWLRRHFPFHVAGQSRRSGRPYPPSSLRFCWEHLLQSGKLPEPSLLSGARQINY